eukprot:SAG25_NODE_256_length_10933_cov_24.263522_1_plen_67_part_00
MTEVRFSGLRVSSLRGAAQDACRRWVPPLDPLRTGSYTYDLGRAWKWVREHADASVLDAQAERAQL